MLTAKQVKAIRRQGHWTPEVGAQSVAFALLHTKGINGIFYGGARGGGKSDLLRHWIAEPVANPDYNGLILRKNSIDLADFISRAKKDYTPLGGVKTGNPAQFTFPSGAFIRTGHMDGESAIEKYQGNEIHRLGIEELTQIATKDAFIKLLASNRSTVDGIEPKFCVNANPSGRGMLWVKDMFINPDPKIYDVEEMTYEFENMNGEQKVCRYKIITEKQSTVVLTTEGEKEVRMKFAFVPARVEDNSVLIDNNPQYVAMLENMKHTDNKLYRAWRHGDWDVFIGQVFDEWREEIHTINNFKDEGVDKEQFEKSKKYIAMDWGYNDPCSIHWFSFHPEDANGRTRVIVYREWYENKIRPHEWANRLREQIEKEPVDYLGIPEDAYNNSGGQESVATVISRELDKLHVDIQPQIVKIKLEKGSRANRQAILHDALWHDENHEPILKIFKSCRNVIRSIPALTYDEHNSEQVDTKIDHEITNAYDSLSYGLTLIKTTIAGSIVRATERLGTDKVGYEATKDGKVAVGAFIDLNKAIKESTEINKDWTTT